MTPGQAVVEALKSAYAAKRFPLTIVETGTIRKLGDEYRIGDGYSTMYIAEWIRSSGVAHRFYSIDLSVAISRQVLEEKGLLSYVALCEGDSAVTLASFDFPIDFAYLDSCADPEQNLKEFHEVHSRLRLPGIVMIDDVHNWPDVNKGKLTVPLACGLGYKETIIGGRQALLEKV